jgi:thiol-disulfide isomerase/thioredoxin
MIILKSDLINNYLKINNDIIVVFGSNNCKYCNELKPKLYELSQQHPEKEIIYVDGDKFPNSADLYDVEEYPTVIHFINQSAKERFITNNINKIKKIWF